MLNKIRRSSKQVLNTRRSSNAPQSPQTLTPQTTLTSGGNLTFFDLPAEIRNVVYEHIAIEAVIFIALPTKKNAKQLPPVPSLLLVSKQTRREYLPLLLEMAEITIQVKDYDFRNTVRLSSSLYRTELKALRMNEQLTIQLQAEKCSQDALVSLRRWLENRATGLDRLPWQYSIAWRPVQQYLPTSTPVQTVNAYIMRKKVLNHNLEALGQLQKNVEEMVQFELQPIIEAFSIELAETGAEPNSPWRGNTDYARGVNLWGTTT